MHQAGFHFRILWCSQSDDRPENNLAKFVYLLDIKMNQKKTTEYF
jgi:hypothetical protein